MKILGEIEEKILYKTILFDNQEEKIDISFEMKQEGWEDLSYGKGALRVVFKKVL